MKRLPKFRYLVAALATVVGTNTILLTPTFAAVDDTTTFNFGEVEYGDSTEKTVLGSRRGQITSGKDYFNIDCGWMMVDYCTISTNSKLDANETPYTGEAKIGDKTYALSAKVVPADIDVTIYGSITNVKVFNGKEQSYTGFNVNAPRGYSEKSVIAKDDAKNTVSGTNVGTYTTALDASNFENTDKNYNVNFKISEYLPSNALTITKAIITPTLSVADAQYGDELEPTITGNLDNGEETIYYRTAGSRDIRDWSTTAPTEPGEYEAFATVAATENCFAGASDSTTFEITKREVTVNVIGNSKTVFYNGKVQTVQGFEFNLEDDFYDLSSISVNGLALAPLTATEVGVYENILDEEWFTNLDEEHFDVTFNITSGTLTIKEAPVIPVKPVTPTAKETPLAPNTGLTTMTANTVIASTNENAMIIAAIALASVATLGLYGLIRRHS